MRSISELKRIAKENGWKLNPKTKIVNAILKRLNINFDKYGYFACPCKPNEINKKVNVINDVGVSELKYIADCPCLNAQNEINEKNHCHCNLFYKNDG